LSKHIFAKLFEVRGLSLLPRIKDGDLEKADKKTNHIKGGNLQIPRD